MTIKEEIRPGYKQTEVGVIPEEWGVSALGVLATVERGKFSARPRNDPKFYGGNIPFLQTGDISRSSGKVTTFSQTLNAEGAKVSRVFPKGTLLFTIAANIGDVGITDFDAACPDSLVAVAPHQNIDCGWLLFELAKRKADFESLASPGAQLNINLEKLRPYLLPRPPHPEQRAIATALADADALIAALEGMIAKKRDLKQAAMQHLLTGKTRLPGFSGEWEVKRLGNVAAISKGAQLQSSGINSSGRFPHYNGGVSPSGFTDEANCPAGTVAISEGGNSCGFVNYITSPFWCGGHCYALSFHRDDKLFLYQYLKSRQSDIMSLRVGSGLPNVQKTALSNLLLTLPTNIAEQTAIAEVLSDMDADLAALEAQAAKACAVKQGMMQELLTGRVRLV